jgi:GNAT superfamily N-acetyltransferase
MYPIGYFRARAILAEIDLLHHKYVNGHHYYLDNLGVAPSAQGRRLSSGLIRPFLQMADKQRVITYTDTVSESNVPFYEHFGFKCVETSRVANTGVTVYALRRPIPA